MITVEGLAAKGIAVGTPTHEGVNISARRFINGTTELEYAYDSEKDAKNSAAVVFYSEADTSRNEEMAIRALDHAIKSYQFGAAQNKGDLEVVESAVPFTLGEQNYSAVLQSKGVMIGNLVVTRKGTLVYNFILSGPVINSVETLNDLIGPKLRLYKE